MTFVPPAYLSQSAHIYATRYMDVAVATSAFVSSPGFDGLAVRDSTAAVKAVWLIDERYGSDLRLRHQSFQIPTTTVPVIGWYVENLAIAPDLSVGVERRPREEPFTSFYDYRGRFTAATRSLFANAAGYEPIVALSGGYDSSAVAAVAAAAGATRAIGFAAARSFGRAAEGPDSGAAAAAAFGLRYVARHRLAYRE